MVNSDIQQKGNELLATLAQKSWDSNSFKERLINNPKEVISEVVGKDLSHIDKKIIVNDQSDDDAIYINIPQRPNMDGLALTEEQLEQVAGGVTPTYLVGFAAGIGVCKLVSML